MTMKHRGQHRGGKHTAEAQAQPRVRKSNASPTPTGNIYRGRPVSEPTAVKSLIAGALARLKGNG